jgi:hypothetical protein
MSEMPAKIACAAGRIAALAVLLCLAAVPAGAQAGQSPRAPRDGPKSQAILERGPVAGRGIPFFPPNVLAVFRGEYLAGQSRIEVYFTREQLVLPAGWRKASCGQEALLRLDGEEKPTFCYVEPGDAGYVLFLSFAAESFPWCAWTGAFLQRLRSLLAFSQGSEEVAFPAILDY